MRRAVVALVTGLLLAVVGFGVGTTPRTAQVAGTRVECGAAVPASWLVPGTPATQVAPQDRAACASAVEPARWAAYAVTALGALLVLGGWTATRELGRSRRPATAWAAG